MHHVMPIGAAFVDSYSMQLAVFDGTNDYLTRGADLTGNADTDTGTFSAWIDFQGGDGVRTDFFRAEGGWLEISKQASNSLRVIATKSGGGDLSVSSASTYTVSSGMLHILASWDLSASAVHLYVNDTDDAGTPSITAGTIDYTRPDYGIGARDDGTNKINAKMGDVWWDNSYIDFSVAANRRLFIDSLGNPVDLGSDGSSPGVVPLVFLSGDVATWHTNKGDGGGFTESGALTDGGTYPA